MTTKLYTLLLFSICMSLIGCQPGAPGTEAVEKKKPNKPADSVDCERVADYPVFTATCQIWEDSWVNALSEIYPGANVSASRASMNKRFMDSEKVLSVLEQCTTCTDVRFYFAQYLAPPNGMDLVPDMIMVNANGCVDVLGDSVLVCDSSQTQQISVAEGSAATAAWLAGWPQNQPWLKQMKAYTFERHTIEELASSDPGFPLEIHFSLHMWEEKEKKTSPPPIQGLMQMNIVVSKAGSLFHNGLSLDFAQPCPELCDKQSPLYHN